MHVCIPVLKHETRLPLKENEPFNLAVEKETNFKESVESRQALSEWNSMETVDGISRSFQSR